MVSQKIPRSHPAYKPCYSKPEMCLKVYYFVLSLTFITLSCFKVSCAMMCSDTKEYPLKLSGYCRVQIPCTLLGCIYIHVHWLACGEPKAHPPPLKGSLFKKTTMKHL